MNLRRKGELLTDLMLVFAGGYLLFADTPSWSKVLGVTYLLFGVWQPSWWRKNAEVPSTTEVSYASSRERPGDDPCNTEVLVEKTSNSS